MCAVDLDLIKIDRATHSQQSETGCKARGKGKKKRSKSKSSKGKASPFGLGSLICNSHKTHQRIEHVFLNLKDEKDLLRDFQKMKAKVEGSVFTIKNIETGEIIFLPNGSRWNSKSKYFPRMRARLFKEIEGLRHARLLTLSFDPTLIESHVPHWWPWGIQEFLIVFGNLYVSRFLKRYQIHWKRKGRDWHYIASVMEIQPGTGNVHYHMVFRGSWLGDAKTLLTFWEGSNQPAGLEISKGKNAKGAIRYVAKYITKLESFTQESKWKDLNIFMWYFRVRIYNLRHHRKADIDKSNSQSISPKQFEYVRPPSPTATYERIKGISDGTWTDEDEKKFQSGPLCVEGAKMTGNLKIDLKRIRELPVLYPEQVKETTYRKNKA